MPIRPNPRDQLRHSAQLNLQLTANWFEASLEPVLRPEGLSAAQARVLWVLCLHPNASEGLTMGELSDGNVTRAADTTRLVSRLVETGLARRENSATDRRVVRVWATDPGRDAVERIEPALRANRKLLWHGVTDAELRELDRLLIKVLWSQRDPT